MCHVGSCPKWHYKVRGAQIPDNKSNLEVVSCVLLDCNQVYSTTEFDNFLHFNYTESFGGSVKTFEGYAYFFQLTVELLFHQNLTATTSTTTLHLSICLCSVNATREKVRSIFFFAQVIWPLGALTKAWSNSSWQQMESEPLGGKKIVRRKSAAIINTLRRNIE